jgi:hypothetical protein
MLKVGRDQLKDALRTNQILQTPIAQVAERHSWGNAITYQFLRGEGEEDLPAVPPRGSPPLG